MARKRRVVFLRREGVETPMQTLVCYMAKILNPESSFETQSSKKNFFVQLNQDFIVYLLKTKLAVSQCLFIFPPCNIEEGVF